MHFSMSLFGLFSSNVTAVELSKRSFSDCSNKLKPSSLIVAPEAVAGAGEDHAEFSARTTSLHQRSVQLEALRWIATKHVSRKYIVLKVKFIRLDQKRHAARTDL